VLPFYPLDHLSRGMVFHIAAMNVVAPLLVLGLRRRVPSSSSPAPLWAAAAVQMLLLWLSHAPVVHGWMIHSTPAALLGSVLLALAALWFWHSLLGLPDLHRWQSIPALLLTAKLACLLGALLVFAPRPLYGGSLDDQQLAGLLMIAACPLSYLTAAIILSVQLVTGRLSLGAADRSHFLRG
jgi:putative membrane protein